MDHAPTTSQSAMMIDPDLIALSSSDCIRSVTGAAQASPKLNRKKIAIVRQTGQVANTRIPLA